MAGNTVNNIRKRVGTTMYKKEMLQPNDRILIGLSGGKDSLALIDILNDRRKYVPFSFELFAIHIHLDEVGYQANLKYLKDFCEQRDVPLILKNQVLQNENPKKTMCFICSWTRRKLIFETTRELDCNKLAFGHHMDDAVETLLMNQLFHASISGMPYKLRMFDGRVEVIRPLLDLRNAELQEYAAMMKFEQQIKDCPYENTSRMAVNTIIKNLEKVQKNAVKNIFRSTNKIFPEYLP